MRKFGLLALFLLLAFAAAAIGGFFPPGEWYAGLTKPAWNPPAWVFGPVWTVLYITIGVAGWWLWRARPETATAFRWWAIQLALNALWSPLFFGLEAPGAALVVILALLLAIAATILTAYRVCRPAAWLLVPYLLWVAFATVLNATLHRLN